MEGALDTGDDEQQSDERLFRVTFALDRDGYFRHRCSQCGRQFKTKAREADLVSAVQPAFKEAGIDLSSALGDDDAAEGGARLECPYCGHSGGLDEMLTAPFADYLKRFLYSEYIEPQISQILSDFSDSIGGSARRSSGGLFSIEVSSDYSRGVRSCRPISSPDAPDMTKIHFLCCDSYMKLEAPFKHISQCPYCHESVRLV